MNPRVLSWLLLALPLGVVLVGVVMLAVRWARTRRRLPADPEALLLSAVSGSLRERGELAASLGELRTVHERLLDALPMGLVWVDQRQRLAALNRRGRELLGVTEQQKTLGGGGDSNGVGERELTSLINDQQVKGSAGNTIRVGEVPRGAADDTAAGLVEEVGVLLVGDGSP